ncbi:acetylcholinesterase-like, partial [Oppia nitens]|uniref:acetylcholinesterase-like n=1 Tax=Oppia nitens TaxID=1686743 RepID=UPI0023DA522F
ITNCIDIKTTSGVVRGQTIQVLNKQIDEFIGIPYAEPPVGKLRFAKPQPIIKPAPDIINATIPKNSCWQLNQGDNQTFSEDCLFVNIWSPNRVNQPGTNGQKPVMFWIHGGGFTIGSIFLWWYNGSVLAANDVVVVTTNYRLGVFGFLYGADESAPGNVGLYDQLLALKWVRDNIEAFGGDPNQVTIFGESAGSWSVSAHILSPLSKGLYSRAIMESGALMFNKDRDPISTQEALELNKQIAYKLNCTDNWLQCLKNVKPEQLVTPFLLTLPIIKGTEFLPFRTQTEFEKHLVNTDIDLIAGVTRDEGSLADQLLRVSMDNMTVANWTFDDFIGDLSLKCPTYLFTRLFNKIKAKNKNVYFYEWTYLSEKISKYIECDIHKKGICHGVDIPYVFGLPFIMPDMFDEIDKPFSDTIIQIILVIIYLVNITNCIDIKTTSGVVRGQTIQVLNKQIDEFIGIPFAEPPVGELRFAKPKPIIRPAPDIIDATIPKNSCWQLPSRNNQTYSEDCLFVNIWTPNRVVNESVQSGQKPVMFYIYGGSFVSGSIFLLNLYNGSVLATNDVVIVTTNYRLGVLGFLYGADESAPGNAGLYDQLLALKWVKDNIEAFGGDPNQVTIFGQSAGSISVSAHILSPLSKGLYRRAIMESGALMFNKDRDPISTQEALELNKQIGHKLNCTGHNWLQCLRNVRPEQLVFKLKLILPLIGTEFLPVRAIEEFQKHSVNTDIDLIAGVTRNEGSIAGGILSVSLDNMTVAKFTDYINKTDLLFHNLNATKIEDFYLKSVDKTNASALRRAFQDFFGDVALKCPTYLFARQLNKIKTKTKNVYFYEFTYISEKFSKYLPNNIHKKDICHGSDIPYVFGLPFIMPDMFEPIDQTFSKSIIQMWTEFTKTGKPDNLWPLIESEKSNNVLVCDLNPKNMTKIFENPFYEICDIFWKNFYIN